MDERLTDLSPPEVIDRAMTQLMGTPWKVESSTSSSVLFCLQGTKWGCSEVVLALILFALGIVPGIIYLVARSSSDPGADARLKVTVLERRNFNIVRTEVVGRFGERAAYELLNSLPLPNDLLEQGIRAVMQGCKKEARQILEQLTSVDKRNEQAWLWLSGAVDTDQERRRCLEKVLKINPCNERAEMGLAQLGFAPRATGQEARQRTPGKRGVLIALAILAAVLLASAGFVAMWWVSRMGLLQAGGPAPTSSQEALVNETETAKPDPTAIPTWTPSPTPDVRSEIREYQSAFCPLMEEALSMQGESAYLWAQADPDRLASSPTYHLSFVSKHDDLLTRFQECEDRLRHLAPPLSLAEFHRLFVAHCDHYGQWLAHSHAVLEGDATPDYDSEELRTSEDYFGRSLQEFSKATNELGLGLIDPCPDVDLEEVFGRWPTTTPETSAALPQPAEATDAPPSATVVPAAPASSMVVDDWEVSIERVLTADTVSSGVSDNFVKAAGRFALLFLRVANRGLRPRTFVAFGTLEVEDSVGMRYEEDFLAAGYAQGQYNTDIAADLNPDETAHVVAVFDVPADGESYALVPGILAHQYGEEVLRFDVP
jgi:hypothetical protein